MKDHAKDLRFNYCRRSVLPVEEERLEKEKHEKLIGQLK